MIPTGLNPPQSVWNSLIPFWQTICIFFLLQSMWKVAYAVQIQRRMSQEVRTNGQRPLYILEEAFLGCFYITSYHWANIQGKYADGFHYSMIDNKDGIIPWPLIMITCTALRHALVEWQKNTGVHPKASRSTLKADTPDRSNNFNYMIDGGKIASCCAAAGRKVLTSLGIADMYTFLMNTRNTLPESYQQRVYKNTLATVQRHIEQLENPTPAEVIRVEAARVDNVILLEYLTSEIALEEPEIGSTDPNIPISNNCTDDELHFGIWGGSGDDEDEGDECDERDVIPTSSQRPRPVTELRRFDLGTSDVDGYEGDDGEDVDVDEEEEASLADDGSTQNVEDWGHITRECADWTWRWCGCGWGRRCIASRW